MHPLHIGPKELLTNLEYDGNIQIDESLKKNDILISLFLPPLTVRLPKPLQGLRKSGIAPLADEIM